ncbi:MAG: extensin family protein [bacterium]
MIRRVVVVALLLGIGAWASPTTADARARRRVSKRKPPKPRCDSSRYKCTGKRPTDYDELVRITYRPAKGQDAACLSRLRKAGIKFRMLRNVKGVKTPVHLLSKRLGRVLYRKTWNNKRRFILDCRMVEVLAAQGREIRRAGIASIYFSSSWRHSLVKGTSRLSKHAYGLALDVTAIDGAFGYASVIRHYERGQWGCGSRNKTPKGKAWRAFFCALRKNNAFRHVFTPDRDRYHRDHFHIEGPSARIRLQPKTGRKGGRRR